MAVHEHTLPGTGTANAKVHYDTFLAEHYSWLCGGYKEQVAKNRQFFAAHDIFPGGSRVAIDLGAGCGFQSVPLAGLGFFVIALDTCLPLLDELCRNAGDLPVQIIAADMLDFPSWAGRHPELITCMGDTLTHLPDLRSVDNLIRHCSAELEPGGKLVLVLRDYSKNLPETKDCFPVRRDPDRIFLCSPEYHEDTVTVKDILYSRVEGCWRRDEGRYPKIRISTEHLDRMLRAAGFTPGFSAAGNIISIIATKE
jgi:SAM-dependent methyltransferase